MLARACGEDADLLFLQFTAILTVWISLLSEYFLVVHEKELLVRPEENPRVVEGGR